ncbi:MAG: hypothetical protein U0744_18655 [Gemmataceae bacterium]
MNRWDRRLALFLRASAIILGSAIVATLMPLSLMASLSRWVSIAEMPETPIVSYLARSCSAMYAMLGLLYWRVSLDVPRYRELIRFLALCKLAFGIGILAIDFLVGMPTWWVYSEGPFIIVWSLTLLLLKHKADSCRKGSSSPDAESEK